MDKNCYKALSETERKHFWHKTRRDIIKKIIKKQNLQTKRILDIGCGTGGNYDMLSQFGTVTNVEYDSDAIKYFNKAHKGVSVYQGALPDQLPADVVSQKYDLIVLLDVLEHIEEDAKTLDTLKGLLTPDGCILLTVPALPFLYGNFDKCLNHFRRYSKKQLLQIARQADMPVRFIRYFNFILSPLVIVKRVLDKNKKNYSFEAEHKMPHKTLNALFGFAFGIERVVLPWIHFPWGVSLVAILSKKDAENRREKNV